MADRLAAAASPSPERAVCFGRGGRFLCSSLDVTPRLSLTFHLAAHFISHQTIWRQTEDISISHLTWRACVRQCAARGQAALPYLGLLYDKALMKQLLELAHVSINKVHHNINDFL